MKFLVDTQLPPKLSEYITAKGHECVHTSNYSDGHLMKDNEIIQIAITEERTVVSKDSDFSDNFNLKGAPPKVLYLSFGNTSNSTLLAYFEQHFDTIVDLFEEGIAFIEFGHNGISVREY